MKYALRKAAEDSKNHYPKALEFVQKNIFRDNFIKPVPSEPEGMCVFEDITSCLKEKGFELKKWFCISKCIMSRIPIELQSGAKTKAIELEPLNLSTWDWNGMWRAIRWKFQRTTKGNFKRCHKKSFTFSCISSFFPVGLFASYTMQMKILLKTVCKQTGQE